MGYLLNTVHSIAKFALGLPAKPAFLFNHQRFHHSCTYINISSWRSSVSHPFSYSCRLLILFIFLLFYLLSAFIRKNLDLFNLILFIILNLSLYLRCSKLYLTGLHECFRCIPVYNWIDLVPFQ